MLFLAVFVQLTLAQAAPLGADYAGQDAAWLQACAARIEADAAGAYEDGMARSAETQRPEGFQCAALALVELGRPAEAARRLQAMGAPTFTPDPAARAELLAQAGAAWLLAEQPAAAGVALSQAITLMAAAPEHLPDLYIDRAQAFAMAGNWREAEEDLSRALDLRGQDALALRLRATARMRQMAFPLAQADAEAAVALDPANVDARLVLGHVREAIRTGRPVE